MMSYQIVVTVCGEEVKVTTNIGVDFSSPEVVVVMSNTVLIALETFSTIGKIVQTFFKFSSKLGYFVYAGALDVYTSQEGIGANLIGGAGGIRHTSSVYNGISADEHSGSSEVIIEKLNGRIGADFQFNDAQ